MARPKGTKDSTPRTRQPRRLDNQRKLNQIRAGLAGLSPLDMMLKVMRDDTQPLDLRLDMAAKAAPYVHARLQAVHQTSGATKSHAEWLKEMAEDDDGPGRETDTPETEG